MAAFDPTKGYAVPEEVLAAELGGEAVLVNLGTSAYFRLNPTATLVWQGVERGLDRAALLDELCASYEVERETASLELDRVLGDLEARSLIVGTSVAV